MRHMTKNWKKLAVMFLAVLLIITFLPVPGAQTAYAAEDIRTPITEIVATSNIVTPVYGEPVVYPEIEVVKGSPAYFYDPGWLKKSGDDWEEITGGTFTAGTYTVSAMLRIDSGGDEYVLGWPLTVTVDGQEWHTGWPEPEVYPTYSRLGIGGPYYVVEEPPEAPLVFNNSSSFNIPDHYAMDPITSYSVADHVSGGQTPYVFSKTSGPDWIIVSADGTVSGTPTTVGSNKDLVIRVTDNNGDYKEITIDVGYTRMRLEDRTAITEVVATTNIGVPVYGAEIITPTITVKTGSPAFFDDPSWYIKEDGEWKNVTDETFKVGTYIMAAMLRINNGTEYILGWPLTVTVDGQEWHTGWTEPEVYPTYSRLGIGSPEFEVRKPIDQAVITLPDQTYTYNGSEHKPMPTVSLNGVKLEKDTDYTVSYKNNVNAGTNAKVIITGKGEYGGTIDKAFTIKRKAITPTVTLSATALAYNGNVRKPTVTVKDGTKTLTADNYTVTYASGRKNIGTYDVTVNMKGNYSGKKTVKFSIKGNLSYKATKVSVQTISARTYSGSAFEPTPKVKAIRPDGTVGYLTAGTDFKYSYSNNKYVGKASVKISGIGNYSGSKTVYFKINPKGTTLKTVTPLSKSVKVTWNKQATQTTGYVVWISSKADFSTKAYKTISSTGTLSATFTGLRGNTKYYVKIKTYKKLSDGSVYYSGWSGVKTVTTKA